MTPLAKSSGDGKRCEECQREPRTWGSATLCISCWKRLVWRPRNAEAVERDREKSRQWKAENLERKRAYDRAYHARKRQEAA